VQKIKSVAVVESRRNDLGTGKISTQRRYFISSLSPDSGERFARLIRNHHPCCRLTSGASRVTFRDLFQAYNVER
jgi:hypothetical protein